MELKSKRLLHSLIALFQQSKGLGVDGQWYGSSIFTPWLKEADLIRMPDIPNWGKPPYFPTFYQMGLTTQSYIPTEKGLELYERLKGESFFEHR